MLTSLMNRYSQLPCEVQFWLCQGRRGIIYNNIRGKRVSFSALLSYALTAKIERKALDGAGFGRLHIVTLSTFTRNPTQPNPMPLDVL